jgi:hypothetical protein
MQMQGTSGDSTQPGAGVDGSAGLRAANRRLALGIVCGMLILAAITLYAGLKSMPGRRALDARDPMAFLPPDSNLVAMVEISKVLQGEAGNELFNDFRLRGIGIAQVEHWLGLPRKDIAVLVVASHVDRQPIPRTVLVIETLHPHSEVGLRGKRKESSDGRLASSMVLQGDKRLYRVAGDAGTPSAYLWCAAETIFVIALDAQDFDAVPDEPHRGLDYLDRDLCRLLIDCIPKDAEAFVAAHGEGWDKTTLSSYVERFLGPDSSKSLSDFCCWARFDKSVDLGGSCRIASSEAIGEVRRWLKSMSSDQVQAGPQTNQGWLDVTARMSAQDLERIRPAKPRR